MEKDNDKLKQLISDEIKQQLAGEFFTARKLTDTPTDDLQVVNRKYITNHGTVRPTSSVIGQPFIDTTLASGRGKPIWWNGIGFIDATGAYI